MRLLSEPEAKQMLEAIGIPTTGARAAHSPEEAVAIARQVGYPVVLKILSPEVTHKSDIGGVKLNIPDDAGVRRAYGEILQALPGTGVTAPTSSSLTPLPGTGVTAPTSSSLTPLPGTGVTVQRMAPLGVELIVGTRRDPQFGPVLLFGMGGTLVELYRDVALRLIPVGDRDIEEMMGEVRGLPLLRGYRGRPPADLERVREVLRRVSRYVGEHPEVREMDINPLLAYPDGVLAVDARAVLE
ncbi:MAG: acetate--CoA ligase family protein [Euryarchaeota archaeon]|nr:acetate--CoA ligase family protein [Euryarchaeota archaeon]